MVFNCLFKFCFAPCSWQWHHIIWNKNRLYAQANQMKLTRTYTQIFCHVPMIHKLGKQCKELPSNFAFYI